MKIKRIEYDAEFGVMVDIEELAGYRICLPLDEQENFVAELKTKIQQLKKLPTVEPQLSLSAEMQLKLEKLKSLEGSNIDG